MLKINNNHENDILLIADCLEDDYFLYKKLYKKLARRLGFKKENVFVITEKTFKQLAFSRHGKDIDKALTLFSIKLISNLVDSESTFIYCLCNIQRQEPFKQLKKIFSEEDLKKMYIQYFGYYMYVCGIREHPITEALSDVICTTSLTPDKNYLEDLAYAFNHLQRR